MEAAKSKTVARAPAPAPAPAAHPVRAAAPAGRVQLQSALKVSSPGDAAEKEAESTARRIVRMPAPSEPAARPQPLQSPHVARFRDAVAPAIHRKAEGQPNVASNVAAEISASTASGSPLPASVRRFMEPRFRTNFSNVRIHTNERAARLNRQLNAQAFTVGNQIFFGRGRFRPESADGQELLAHELTHTIQQGATVQRSAEEAPVTQQSPPQVQRLGLSDALDYFADKANLIPGFRMFTIILGINPINMSRVERSAANILRAVIEMIPGGALITQAMENNGVFDRVGAWVEQQIRTLGMTGRLIRDGIDRFLDSLSWTDIFDLGGVWDRAKRIFTEPIDRIISFIGGLVSGIIGFIKDAILRPLARLAEGTRGYDLLKAVLGQDPITGDPVPRNAETLIGGFMRLIGQEEIWQNIQRSGAVARAWAWFQGALSGLLGFVQQIPSLFIQAFRSLEIADIILVPRAFAKIISVFGGFVGRFFSWAGETIWNLLEIIFSVVAPNVMPYLRRAAGAFRTILRNPIGFIGNLVRAGIQGLRQFARNFVRHLTTSLIGWLTGALSGANIYIPQGLNLREILKFVLSVLGLTWQNIRQKLVRATSETTVRVLETGFDIVMTLVTQGPAAAWEKILESLSNLRAMVIDRVVSFVRERVIEAAITRLLTSLNPVGAFIQAIIAIYNTVMFFVERLRQIAQVAAAVIDSLSAIASGVIATAANRVEETMAGLLTLVISFLARIAGLGRVSDMVTEVVNRIRQPIDQALDRVVEWIVATARRLGRFIAQAGLPQDPNERLQLGMRAAVLAVNRFAGRRVGMVALTPLLAAVRVRYGFRTLEAVAQGNQWVVEGQINPRSRNVTDALIENVRERSASQADDFDPDQFSDAEIRTLYDRARRLGLDIQTIRDLIFIAGRREKPITRERLIVQMNNWVRIVNPRGFPYRFQTLSAFSAYSSALLGGLSGIGLPTGDVRVQGSALRNPDARDIDIAVILPNDEFNTLLVTAFAQRAKREGQTFLVNDTAARLSALAADIDARRAPYNADARTFAFAMRERKIRPQDVRGLAELQGRLEGQFGAMDISVMTAGGSRELRPYLRIG
jgi:hypothetical protein